MARRKESPVEQASIRDLMIDGRGVADLTGKAVFVDGALAGEEVRFRRRRRRKNYDEAELLEVVVAAADRIDPRCDSFGICGGCALQHLEAGAQLRLKEQVLLDALQRIGGIAPEQLLPALAGRPFGYRRRARLGVRRVDKKNRVLVGFREKHKPYIADMQHCETLVEPLAELISPLAELIETLSVKRDIPQVELSYGDNFSAAVVRVLTAPAAADLQALQSFAERHNVQVWLQTGGPDTLRLLDGSREAEPLEYELPEFGLRLQYGPLDFVQVNQDMNQRMLTQALQLLHPRPGEKLLDLFCGIGNFSLPLARSGAVVTGIELDAAMVGKARDNARFNRLDNAEFQVADLSVAGQQQPWWRSDYDAVLLDPPRAGALEALPLVAGTGAGRLLYVSCHPGSLARDAGILVREHGYRLRKAGVMDMFPQTGHVEAMALFERAAT